MAIYSIPTYARAVEIMDAAYLHPCEYNPIIFDLDDYLDPNFVRTRISQCVCCDLTIHQNLGEYLMKCPRCREEEMMKELVDVQLVIQGSKVIHTLWRQA